MQMNCHTRLWAGSLCGKMDGDLPGVFAVGIRVALGQTFARGWI
jgi:hypothetical protein